MAIFTTMPPVVIYSFDIFDTLVTRVTGTPAGVFNLMQREIVTRELPLSRLQTHDFRNLRVYSEREAYADKRPFEVTLDDIYRKLGECLQVSAETLERLKALEVECEARCVVPIEQNLQNLFEALSQGQRVILASDMYLPRSAIKEILDRVNPAIYESTTLYLSSETGQTKRSGSLFKLIAEREGVKYSEILHTGDNRNSDYLTPRSLGIRTNYVNLAKLRRWETLGVLAHVDGCAAAGGMRPRGRQKSMPSVHFPEVASDALNLWEMSSGLARRARLMGATPKYLLGYSLAAPILVPFAYWALTEASRRNIDRLYFVARDGQIFLKIARQLQQRGVCSNLDLRYLFGSRRAWHLPSFRNFDDHDLFWIIDSRRGLSLRKLAHRLGLEINQLLDVLEKTSVGKNYIRQPDTVLSTSEIRKLPNILRSSAQLKEAVANVASRANQTLLKYLDQEGWNQPGIRKALVDVGWSGRSQDSLFRALSHTDSDRQLTGLYFGLHCHTEFTSDRNMKLPFALHPHHFYSSPNGRHFFEMIHVLECLTAADHGGTVTYEFRDGLVSPKLDGQGAAVSVWGVDQFQRGILDYADQIIVGPELANPEAVRVRLRDTRRYLFEDYPETEIADALGSYPFTPEMDGAGQQEFAPKLSVAEALRYITIAPQRRNAVSAWLGGSYVRSNLMSKLALSMPFRATLSLLFHPLHTASSSIRAIVRLIPDSLRPWIRNLIPPQHAERVQMFVSAKRLRKKF